MPPPPHHVLHVKQRSCLYLTTVKDQILAVFLDERSDQSSSYYQVGKSQLY